MWADGCCFFEEVTVGDCGRALLHLYREERAATEVRSQSKRLRSVATRGLLSRQILGLSHNEAQKEPDWPHLCLKSDTMGARPIGGPYQKAQR